MSREVRTYYEGELRWVEASGTGISWQTASAVAAATGTGYNTAAWASKSGVIGFVRAGLGYESAQNVVTVMERGVPHHHKVVGREPQEITFEVLFGVTADWPEVNTAVGPSGGYGGRGVSTPQFNLELKMREEEVATASGIYFQWWKCVKLSEGFGEAEDGDTWALRFRALGMKGPTGSGYLG